MALSTQILQGLFMVVNFQLVIYKWKRGELSNLFPRLRICMYTADSVFQILVLSAVDH